MPVEGTESGMPHTIEPLLVVTVWTHRDTAAVANLS